MSTVSTPGSQIKTGAESRRWFLCIDCGGTNTRCAIASSTGNSQSIIGFGTGGPSNFSYIGPQAFLIQIANAVTQALVQAGVDLKDAQDSLSLSSVLSAHTTTSSSLSQSSNLIPKPTRKRLFTSAWLGVSGIDSPQQISSLLPLLSSLLLLPPRPPYLILKNDTSLLSAPLVSVNLRNPAIKTCVCVIGGTGSIAASFRVGPGKNGDEDNASSTIIDNSSKLDIYNSGDGSNGDLPIPKFQSLPEELARIGGWGWLLGDEGGGFHVGRTAIRHLLREYEFSVLFGKPLPPVESVGHVNPVKESTEKELGSVESASDAIANADGDDGDNEEEGEEDMSLRTQILTLFGVRTAPELLSLLHDPDPEPTTLSSAPTSDSVTPCSAKQEESGQEVDDNEAQIQFSKLEGAQQRGKPLQQQQKEQLRPHRLLQRQQRLSVLAPLVFRAAFGDSESQQKHRSWEQNQEQNLNHIKERELERKNDGDSTTNNNGARTEVGAKPETGTDDEETKTSRTQKRKGERKRAKGGDPLALAVLRETSAELANQICMLLSPPASSSNSSSDPQSSSGSTSLLVPASSSLLVLGGSLVGIPPYQAMLFDALAARGQRFAQFETEGEENVTSVNGDESSKVGAATNTKKITNFVHVQIPAQEGALALARLFS